MFCWEITVVRRFHVRQAVDPENASGRNAVEIQRIHKTVSTLYNYFIMENMKSGVFLQ